MDKRFIGIIAALLALCSLVVIYASKISLDEIRTGKDSEGSATSAGEAAYVTRFLNKERVIDIQITLSDVDYQDMIRNAEKEEYKEAAVVIDGVKTENVGIRTKGNSSLNSVVQSNSERYSLKIDFDQYVTGQDLYGLTKLNLNNSWSDASYMREYLSYSLLAEMGVPVPAYCYANIYINGNLAGLYLAVEGIEEPFAERYYGENHGTLYKPIGDHGEGTDLVYIDNEIDSYNGLEAVTTRNDKSDKALLAMIKALNEGKDLGNYLNIDEILRYFAVNSVLVNMDSYQGQFTHNYYLYEENAVFSLLPWDYNLSFGGFGVSNDGTSLAIDQPVSGTTMDQRPLLSKLLEVEEYKNLYHQYIREFITGPFALEKMTAEIAKTADMIRLYVEKDPTKFYTLEQFEQAIGEGSTGLTAATQSETKLMTTNDGKTKTILQGKVDQQSGVEQKGMKRNGNATGLVKFVRERISYVSKQLNGELSSMGTTNDTVTGNINGKPGGVPEGVSPGRMPDGESPPIDVRQRMESDRQRPFDGNQVDAGNFRAGSKDPYVLGGVVLILLFETIIILRKRTKHSI